MNDGAIEKTDLIQGCVQTMRGTGCFEHICIRILQLVREITLIHDATRN